MLRRRSLWQLLLLGCALAPLGCGRVQGDQDADRPLPFELTAAEIRQARHLAEAPLAGEPGQMVFVKIDLLPAPHAESGLRQVQVTHYRYEGDETVYTFVDLKNDVVMSVERRVQVPTGLAAEEKATAEKLARGDARLADLFADGSVRVVDCRPIQPAAQEPLHGRRLALLTLAAGTQAVNEPEVIVDLTTRTVHVK